MDPLSGWYDVSTLKEYNSGRGAELDLFFLKVDEILSWLGVF